jgi:hypothetical protein
VTAATKPALWIIPSRGRPANAGRLHRVMVERSRVSDWCFAIDRDDPTFADYLAAVPNEYLFVQEERVRMGPLVNRVWDVLGRDYATVGFMGDDHVPKTMWFDRKLVDAVWTRNGLWGVAWGDDLLMGDRFPTAGLLGGSMLRAAGYMVPPGLQHLCIDVAWSDLAEGIGCRYYLPEVIIEHRHPAAGKAKLDAGYAANNSPETVAHDNVMLAEWRGGDRSTDLGPTVQRIKEAML